MTVQTPQTLIDLVKDAVSKVPTDLNIVAYSVVNDKGYIFSINSGWVKRSETITGHLYARDEAVAALHVISANTNEKVRIRFNLLGTLSNVFDSVF